MSTMILSRSFHFDEWAEHRSFQHLRRLDAISRWAPWPESEIDDRMELGRRVESLAAEALRDRGHSVIVTSHKTAYDILAGALRVEVKAARPCANGRGVRYQAAIRNHKADLLILACCNDHEVTGWFIIPADALDDQRNLAISGGDPSEYTGKWSPYLDRWDIADAAIKAAGPHPAQLTLWG